MGYYLRRYRILIVLYGIGGLAAIWEITSPDPEQDRVPENYPQMMVELYPEVAEQLYFQGMQAMYGRGDLVEGRRLFEKALATGNKSNERLLHVYAVNLVMLNAESDEIDRAIAKWRRNFPRSSLPDPRGFRGASVERGKTRVLSQPGFR